MTWPDAVTDLPEDDYTREAREQYRKVLAEGFVFVPDPDPSIYEQGPTAVAAAFYVTGRYLHPKGAPARPRRDREPPAARAA